MFQFGYLLLVLLAALPLGRTLLNQQAGGSQVLFVHRLYRDLGYVAAAVLFLICLETALTISLQDYWFDELGQRYRYWLALGLRSGIFFTVVLSIGISNQAVDREHSRYSSALLDLAEIEGQRRGCGQQINNRAP